MYHLSAHIPPCHPVLEPLFLATCTSAPFFAHRGSQRSPDALILAADNLHSLLSAHTAFVVPDGRDCEQLDERDMSDGELEGFLRTDAEIAALQSVRNARSRSGAA